MSTIEQEIITILSEQLGIYPSGIKKDSNLVNDLYADSLDITELRMSIEEQFLIHIPDNEIKKLHTVSDLITYVRIKTKIKKDLDLLSVHTKSNIKSAEAYGQKMQKRAYSLEQALRNLVESCELNESSKTKLTSYQEALIKAKEVINGE